MERLLKKAELEEKRRRLLLGIMKSIKPLEKNAKVYLEMNSQGKLERLEITVYRPVEPSEERSKKIIKEELEMKGFKVEEWIDHISGA